MLLMKKKEAVRYNYVLPSDTPKCYLSSKFVESGFLHRATLLHRRKNYQIDLSL
jgi:hypothetical protein